MADEEGLVDIIADFGVHIYIIGQVGDSLLPGAVTFQFDASLLAGRFTSEQSSSTKIFELEFESPSFKLFST